MELGDAPPTWFHIGVSSDYKRGGAVQRVTRWGQELVVYRATSGRLVVHNATCPHLGAHLGGGTVRGECLECPFHGWQFKPDGDVHYVPGARRMPGRARLDTYPTCEEGGVAFMYPRPSADGVPRPLDPMLARELGDDTQPTTRNKVAVAADVADIQENIPDSAHFNVVHRASISYVRQFTGTVDDHGHFVIEGMTGSIVSGDTDIWARFFDPCNAHWTSSSRWTRFETFILYAQVRPGETDMCLVDRTRRWRFALGGTMWNRYCSRMGARVFGEDLGVLAERRRLDRPNYSDVDGPIASHRRWLREWGQRLGDEPGPQPDSMPTAVIDARGSA